MDTKTLAKLLYYRGVLEARNQGFKETHDWGGLKPNELQYYTSWANEILAGEATNPFIIEVVEPVQEPAPDNHELDLGEVADKVIEQRNRSEAEDAEIARLDEGSYGPVAEEHAVDDAPAALS